MSFASASLPSILGASWIDEKKPDNDRMLRCTTIAAGHASTPGAWSLGARSESKRVIPIGELCCYAWRSRNANPRSNARNTAEPA